MASSSASLTNGLHGPPPPTAATAATAPALDLVNLTLLQLCFDESEFTNAGDLAAEPTEAVDAKAESAPPFVPHAFVANKLEHVTVEVLERDLAAYARHLEAAVLKSVQEEVHEAFVEVSGQLVSAEGTIRRVQAPLEDIESRLEKCRSAISSEREAAVNLLEVATRSELDRVFYSALLEATLLHNSLVQGLEKARQHVPSSSSSPRSPTGPEGAVPSTAIVYSTRELEFLCVTAVRFHALSTRVRSASNGTPEHTASVNEIMSYRDAVEKSLVTLINDHFLSAYAVFAQTPSLDAGKALADATGLYRQLQDEAAFATLFREKVVRPAVEAVISWRAAGTVKSSMSNASASVAETEKVLSSLIASLERTVLVALPLIQDRLGHSVPLIATAVWPAIGDTLIKRFGSVFTTGLPDAFHKVFTVTSKLVATLERACTSPEELLCFRNSPDMNTWREKWSLNVYHGIRRTELFAKLETAFTGPFVRSSAGASRNGFTISAFDQVIDALAWWLDPTVVFIFAAQHLFLKDVCEVISIFTHVVFKFAATADAITAVDVMNNLVVLRSVVERTVATQLAAALQDDAGSVAPPVVQFIAKLIDQRHQDVHRILVTGLVAKCMTHLTHVSSVKRIFSSQNTNLPTSPQGYLADALQDVSNFRQSVLDRKALTEKQCSTIVTEVLDETTAQLNEAVKAALDGAKKQQKSLDVLNKGKSAKSTLERPIERIVLQLYLDVQEYGNMLRPFGVNKEVYKPFKLILDLVEVRAKWLMNNCEGPEPNDAIIAA